MFLLYRPQRAEDPGHFRTLTSIVLHRFSFVWTVYLQLRIPQVRSSSVKDDGVMVGGSSQSPLCPYILKITRSSSCSPIFWWVPDPSCGNHLTQTIISPKNPHSGPSADPMGPVLPPSDDTQTGSHQVSLRYICHPLDLRAGPGHWFTPSHGPKTTSGNTCVV